MQLLVRNLLKSRIGHLADQHPEATPDCMVLLDQFRSALLDDVRLHPSANAPLAAMSTLGRLGGPPARPPVVGRWQSGDPL